jgi:ubiquinone/menaquinone biosynthesis C-methylase UbiE
MAQGDSSFAGSIPATYDRHLGGMLFEPYAEDMAQRLADLAGGTVLETACGTGIVTRALARALPGSVSIVATDLNQPMLDYAATKLGSGNVRWQQADAQALPFEPHSFDVVLCQFGVMFFPDKPRAFREARRVLRPGGRYLFSVWDRIESNEIMEVTHRAVAAHFPENPPGFLRRTPCGHHDTAALSASLEAAGFARVEVETVEFLSRTPSAAHAATGLCQGTPLRNEIEERDPAGLATATDAAAADLAERFGAGEIEAPMCAHVLTAWA